MITLEEIAKYLNLKLTNTSTSEYVALTYTDNIELSYKNYFPQEVLSLTVANTTETKTYTELEDYNVSLAENKTLIARISDGDIDDGEIVKVSYSYINYRDYKKINDSIEETYNWLKNYCNNNFKDGNGNDNFPISHKPTLAKLIYYFAINNKFDKVTEKEVKSKGIGKIKVTYETKKQIEESILREFEDLRRIRFL